MIDFSLTETDQKVLDHEAQVAHRDQRVWMLGPEDALPAGQCLLVELAGFGQLALCGERTG